MPHPVAQGGLEIIGCLFGLAFGWIPILGVAAFGVQLLRVIPERQQMTRRMVEFVMGTDRSQGSVKQIHFILLHHFAHDMKYDDISAAVDSFVPGGTAPFYDEVRLADAFRVFLRSQKISVPDEPQDRAGVWPPPPRL